MHKKDLINGLRSKLLKIAGQIAGDNTYIWWKGQRAFAKFLIHYLENLQIPQDEKYDFWRIEHCLPQIVTDAFEELRTGRDEITERFRKAYEEETESDIPNILDLGASRLLDQVHAVQTTLGFMMQEITGEDWVLHNIDSYCNAQKNVLQQTFDKFLRLVFRKGLWTLADKCKNRGMHGKFGQTELRTYITGGRVMFTFARRKKGKTGIYAGGKLIDTLNYQEDSVSFVGEDGDILGLKTGLQSVDADFRTCLNMIEDVIKNWPADAEKQKNIYKPSDVSIA